MITVPLSPPLRMAATGSPHYFAERPPPQSPRDLLGHCCINQRMQTAGGFYVRDFKRDGERLDLRVDGQLIFSTSPSIVDATLAGLGVAFLPANKSPHT